MNPPKRRLILASSSPYRRELLARLQLDFECDSPDIDESALTDESAEQLVQRLALEKSRAVATRQPNSLIIGSDQAAVLADGTVLGKPGTADKAVQQLMAASGNRVIFLTGLCLLNSETGKSQLCCEQYAVQFRALTEDMARRYVEKEQPLNCAGSFKSEGLGITLFEKFIGDDPNSLIGLPLIRLTRMLEEEGILLP
ncbi:MAG: Maf family protein [Alcanivoracaceae bacterium]|nr:Maf family protein [Alcanivoracaceae bacterium]